MIPTIISRCQRFDFRKLTLSEITGQLEFIAKSEKAKIDKAALEIIALNSGGALRDAISLLDQTLTFSGTEKGSIKAEDIKNLLGIVDTNLISQFVGFLADKKADLAMSFLNQTFEKGYDPQDFTRALVNYLRQTILVKINPDKMNPIVVGLSEEDQEGLRVQSTRFSPIELHKMINLFIEAENKIKYSSIPQLPLELAVVDIAHQEA
jgi:DNA polymerase-3 subunit gamma/tau